MSLKTCLLATLALLLVTASWLLAQDAAQPKTVYLWPNGAPGFEDRKDEKEHHERWYATNIHNPSLLVYLPPKEKATGAAVILCPGGGHRTLNYLPEGVDIAKWLNANGIAGRARGSRANIRATHSSNSAGTSGRSCFTRRGGSC